MAPRKAITKQEKIASLLLALDHARCQLDPTLTACLDRERAKQLSADEIERQMKIDWDHYPVPHAWGGSNHPTNLVPRRREEHRKKTAKIDQPMLAKAKRIERTKKFEVTREMATDYRELFEDAYRRGKGKSKWKSQAMPGSKKSGIKKSMSGKVSSRRPGPT